MPKAKGWVEDKLEWVGQKEKKFLGLESGRLLVQQKVIVSMHEHDLGEVLHEWL